MKLFLRDFIGRTSVDLIFESGSNSSNSNGDIWGTTSPQPMSWNASLISLNIDPSIAAQQTPLEIALTILHEAAHAKMYRDLISIGGPGNLSENLNQGKDFAWLYENLKNNVVNQYETLADHYLNLIAFGLREFDQNRFSFAHYQALAWKGLSRTEAWTNYSNKAGISTLQQELLTNRSKDCH